MSSAVEKHLSMLSPEAFRTVMQTPGLFDAFASLIARADNCDQLRKDLRTAADRIIIQSELLAKAAEARVESRHSPADRRYDLYFLFSVNKGQLEMLRERGDVRRIFTEAMVETLPKDSFWEVGR